MLLLIQIFIYIILNTLVSFAHHHHHHHLNVVGLLMLIGLIMYISIFKAEIGSKLRPKSPLQPPLFTFTYGQSFFLYVIGFISTEIVGVLNVFLFISLQQAGRDKVKYNIIYLSAFSSTHTLFFPNIECYTRIRLVLMKCVVYYNNFKFLLINWNIIITLLNHLYADLTRRCHAFYIIIVPRKKLLILTQIWRHFEQQWWAVIAAATAMGQCQSSIAKNMLNYPMNSTRH